MKTTIQLTPAILVHAGRSVAQCETAARGGTVVECCFRRTIEGDHVSSGLATVTRDRRVMTRDALFYLRHATACTQGTGYPV